MNAENRNLRESPLLLCLCFLFLCASCGTHPVVKVQPVGPAMFGASLGHADSQQLGYLIVYSATESHRITKQRTSYPHTGYLIRKANGSTFAWIDNAVDERDETAMLVALPAGSYTVLARDSQCGRVSVPVVIEPWRTTRVDLESRPLDFFGGADSTNLVHLPNGRIVGWRTERWANSKP